MRRDKFVKRKTDGTFRQWEVYGVAAYEHGAGVPEAVVRVSESALAAGEREPYLCSLFLPSRSEGRGATKEAALADARQRQREEAARDAAAGA